MSTHLPAASPSLSRDPGQVVPGGCGSCTACAGGEGGGGVAIAASPLGGAALVAAAAVFFLLPIAFAMAAALLAGAGVGADRRSLAALLGLAAGLGVAVVIARGWTRRLERTASTAAGPLAPPERDREETHHG